MNAVIQTSATIAFKDIFPEEGKPNIPDLLSGIPSCTILTVVAHFMAQIHAKEDDYILQEEIVTRWVNQQPEETRDLILTRFKKLAEKHNYRVNFFNNITSLYFYQSIFTNYNEIADRNLTADEELRLIKAYLIVSERWTEKELKHLGQKPKDDDSAVAYLLPFQMTHNEIQSYKDFRPQLLKAIYFFRFLEQDEKLKEYLPVFLAQYGLTNWEDYLKHTIIPYVISLTGTKSTVLVFDEKNKLEIDYWDTFCIDIKNYEEKPDFLELRESPVFKLKELHYLFFNYNFIIDKLFQSLQFVFSKLLIREGVVKNFGDFKSQFYSEKFSENFMLYHLFEYCIANQKNIVSFNGEELAKKLGEKGPDYYIRVDNHLILIEFKDVLMGAEPKVSYDFEKISHEISRKLIENEDGKAKGVGQLARFINEIPKNGFEFDKFDDDQLNIYPIIIVTDSALSLFGINYLLEKQFSSLIKKDENKSVKHIGLLNLDTLLLFQDLFHENRVNFFDLLNGYDQDFNHPNSLYKFQNLGIYFIDYITHHRISSRSMPDILKEFITNNLVGQK